MKRTLITAAALTIGISSAYAAPSGINWRNGQRLTDTMLQQFDNLKANQQDLSNLSSQIGTKVDSTNGRAQNLNIQGGAAAGTDVTGATSGSTGALTSRTLAERFSDTISVLDYGAKCDGSSFDDAPAFVAAITSGLQKGRKVIFGGRCHFATPVIVSGHGWVGMDLDGRGSTITTDVGISGISIETDGSASTSDRFPISIHNFTITTKVGSYDTVGISLKSDVGWNLDNNSEYGITISNFKKQISLTNIGENHLFYSALFSPSGGIGYFLSGMSSKLSKWSNNNIIDHVEATGGICVNYNGALQGNKIFGLGCMNANQGVIVTNGDLAQSFEVHTSYFDVTRTGVNLDGFGLSIIDNNSADVAGGSPDGTYGYVAFSAKNCGGCKVTNNFVFGLGSSTFTPIVAGGGQAIVTGNYVHGLDGHLTYCIELQTPASLGIPDHILFSNNSCWAAGTFYINGDETRIFGTGNVSSGSGSASSTTGGALAPSLHSYGPLVVRPHDLPTSGDFLRFGNMNGATHGFLTANLDTSYIGYWIELERAGVTQFRVDANGSVTASGNIIVYAGSHICLDASCTNYIYEDATSKKVFIANISSGSLFSIDPSGNVIAKGTITQNGSP